MIEIQKDVVEDHVAELIAFEMKNVQWKFDYPSDVKHQSRHWHVLCGSNAITVIANGFEWVMPIWNSVLHKYNFKDKFNIATPKRIYMNAHTHGVEPVMHRDDGDFTMIYYPRMDWKPEWMGGTAIWDDEGKNIDRYCNYIGNRVLIFPAKNNHQAMPVSRFCYELRPVVVYKLFVKDMNVIQDPNSDRLDFYKD